MSAQHYIGVDRRILVQTATSRGGRLMRIQLRRQGIHLKTGRRCRAWARREERK